MSLPPADPRPPEPLDVVFLFDRHGHAYELPRPLADAHRLTPARLRELGHLPYDVRDVTARMTDADEPEVGGRHRTMSPQGMSQYHADVRFGTYVWSDGQLYRGDHFHPYGDERAEPA
jgi:hypothetical protein